MKNFIRNINQKESSVMNIYFKKKRRIGSSLKRIKYKRNFKDDNSTSF